MIQVGMIADIKEQKSRLVWRNNKATLKLTVEIKYYPYI